MRRATIVGICVVVSLFSSIRLSYNVAPTGNSQSRATAIQISELRAELERTRVDRDQAVKTAEQDRTIDEPKRSATLSPGICAELPVQGQRTSRLWQDHLNQILEWSVHPYDADERIFVPFTKDLLSMMTPYRFQRGIKSVPHRQQASIESLLQVLHKRIEYVQNNYTVLDKESPPPVRILVLGGSVADGDKCNPLGLARFEQRRRKCAWPFRLEFMLNRIFKGDVVNVTAAALGGTNTESAFTLLEYDLVPSDVDILIHAYSTNDMHLQSQERADRDGVTLQDRIFDTSERFIRRALERCRSRPPPLVIFFDDYVGNSQWVIRETLVGADTIPSLLNYYGILGVSYADTVRDFVYGDTAESWFTPQWYKRQPRNKWGFIGQIHPGMGMHIVSAWLLMYSLADVVLAYCDDVVSGSLNSTLVVPGSNNATGNLPYVKPKSLPVSMPPPLYPDLSLVDVSNKWRSQSNETVCRRTNRCIFAWVSRITTNCMVPAQLNATMQKFMLHNDGWEPVYHYFKLGFEATGGKSSKFTLEFRNVTEPISEIMMTVTKSYGEKWADSKARVIVSKQARDGDNWGRVRITTPDIVGYHDKNTSEQYSSTSLFRKGPVEINSHLRVTVELVSGTTFKIMGMALCAAT